MYAADRRPPQVEVRAVSPEGGRALVTTKLEVVLSAGAVHTPLILQRSGIGPRDVLERAGVPAVLVDLPGVGQNFQDHCGVVVSSSCESSIHHPSVHQGKRGGGGRDGIDADKWPACLPAYL